MYINHCQGGRRGNKDMENDCLWAHKISFQGDENGLELDNGHGCTTVQIY